MPTFSLEILSPIGPLFARASNTYLMSLTCGSGPSNPNTLLAQLEYELRTYFSGQRTHFSIPCKPLGSPFQLATWAALSTIQYGSTISYEELASRVGKEGACRAVGSANGKNPILILTPCHRVINKNGALGGFSCGLERKRTLLRLEGIAST